MKLPIDHEARLRSTEPFISFFTEADAGSGKTEQLSRAILVRLQIASSPEKILPITFTKKAASEMSARVFKYLKLGRNDSPPEEPHLKQTWELAKKALKRSDEMGWDILNNPSRLQITTIDSFCLQLVNNHPIANKYGAAITPVEDARLLYSKAADAFLTTKNPLYEKVRNDFVFYCGNDSERAKKYLSSLMGNRDQWLPLLMRENFTETLNKTLKELIKSDIERVITLLGKHAVSEIKNLLQFMQSNLSSDPKYATHVLLSSHLGSIGDLSEHKTIRLFCNIIIRSDFSSLKQSFTKADGIPAGFKNEKEQLLKLISNLESHVDLVKIICISPENDISKGDIEALELIKAGLIATYAELKLIFKFENKMDFVEITQEALNLTNPESIHEALLHIDNKYEHILIDEFQDTSTAHHRLLKNITSHWEHGDGKTVFLVGDPKQSLYLFRSAALGLYISAKKNGIGHLDMENLAFSVNFRSHKSIVDWVNKVFSITFPKEDNSNLGAAKYGHSTPFSSVELDDAINYIVTENTGTGNEDNSRIEAIKVAKKVKELTASVPHETVAILIRSRNYLKHIDAELRNNNITYRGVDLVKLAEKRPIIDLINLTKFIINTSDNLSLLGLLRSPFVGLVQKDIHLLLKRVDETENTLYEVCVEHAAIDLISQDAAKRLSRFLSVFKQHRSSYLKVRFRLVLETIWRELKADHFTEDLQPNDLQSYFALISQIEKHLTIKDWTEFENALDKLYVQPELNTNSNVVVMTIHKSKGLEFDNVLIPGMHRPSTNSDDNIISWAELECSGESDFVMACKPSHGKEKSKHLAYIKQLCRTKELLEMQRLGYVAYTRPIKRLYLFLSININTKTGEIKPPTSTSLIGMIWEAIEGDICAAYQFNKKNKAHTSDTTLTPDKTDGAHHVKDIGATTVRQTIQLTKNIMVRYAHE